MKGKRISEEQIIGVVKEADAGLSTKELCRRHGVSEQTIYRWKAKYGGMQESDVRAMRRMEDENRRLKHLVADLTLDNQALKGVLSKKW
jgi:putative transposase